METTTRALPLLESDVLRTFVAIAETGSFSRAARQVHRTPSAVSMQIKRLENTLGHSLFVREPRRARLTAEGETLLGYARRLLRLNEEAVAEFISPALTGRVRFGTSDDVGTRVLPGVLSGFARSYSSVQVDVMMGRSLDMLASLDAGELDLVLVTASGAEQEADRGELVHTEPLVWAECEGGTAHQRSPLPLSLAGRGCAWRSLALTALDRAGIAYRIAYVSEHCAGQQAAMQADLAVAPFPRSLVRKPLRVVDAEVGLPALGSYRILLLHGASRGPLTETLADFVIQGFRAL